LFLCRSAEQEGISVVEFVDRDGDGEIGATFAKGDAFPTSRRLGKAAWVKARLHVILIDCFDSFGLHDGVEEALFEEGIMRDSAGHILTLTLKNLWIACT
jgi:hypothetical protein